MKKITGMIVLFVLLFSYAAAEQTVVLPGNRYVIDLPDDLEYSAPGEEDQGVQAYVSDNLEMDYLSYSRTEAEASGFLPTLQETAQKLVSAGSEAELRDVNGIEMLVYRVADSMDGAQGIGYLFEDGDSYVEVIFWYATQDAADSTKRIMETIRPAQQ